MLLAGLDMVASEAFFANAWHAFDRGTFPRDAALVTVAHALGSHMPFFNQIERSFGRVGFTVKAKSQDVNVVNAMSLKGGWKRMPFTEPDIQYSTGAATIITRDLELASGEPLFLIDVGGKWADGDAASLKELLKDRTVHLVEGTENGYLKYEQLVTSLKGNRLLDNLRLWSVARSRLKDAEDSLTGRAIVEATETLIRVDYGLLSGHPATVFGYGKIGRSIAMALRRKNLHVGVVEVKPLLQIAAHAEGFQLRSVEEAQELGGYVFLATGSAKRGHGLDLSVIRDMKRDSLVTFVTSFDDELKNSEQFLKSDWLVPVHEQKPTELIKGELGAHNIAARVRESLLSKLHYLPGTPHAKVVVVNGGSPPNFLFEASCGPYIYLVFFGMLACLMRSSEGLAEPGEINVLSESDEDVIGKVWLKSFYNLGSAGRSVSGVIDPAHCT